MTLGSIGFVFAGVQLGLDILDVTTDLMSSASLNQGQEQCGVTTCTFPDYSAFGYALIPFTVLGAMITLFTNIWGCASICYFPMEDQLDGGDEERKLGGTLTLSTACSESMCKNEAFWGYIKLILQDAPCLFIHIVLYGQSEEDGVGASALTRTAIIFTTIDLCYMLV